VSHRAVLFDLGGVVLDSPLHAIARYEQELGIPAGFINRVVVDRGPDGAWSRLERGELPMSAFQRDFEAECLAAGHAISGETLMVRIGECGPRPAMLTAIDRIRERGLRVGALTNNWASDEADRTRALEDRFHVFIESSRVGLRKPDPRIYEHACGELGVTASETIFLDDIGRNLKTARQLGMVTIKVDQPEPAIDELAGLLGFGLG